MLRNLVEEAKVLARTLMSTVAKCNIGQRCKVALAWLGVRVIGVWRAQFSWLAYKTDLITCDITCGHKSTLRHLCGAVGVLP